MILQQKRIDRLDAVKKKDVTLLDFMYKQKFKSWRTDKLYLKGKGEQKILLYLIIRQDLGC